MSEKQSNPLEEAGLRQRLTPEERSRIQSILASNPIAAQEWTTELNLNRALRELPVKPVSSNFTHLVLAAAARTAPAESRSGWFGRFHLFQWMRRAHLAPAPTLALATLVFGTSFLFYRQHQVQVRLQVAHSIARVSDIASILDPEVLQNFDVISRLDEVPSQVDDELLLALK